MNTLCTENKTSLDQLVANQFKRPVVEVVENEIPEKKIFDIDLAKKHKTVFDDIIGLNDENKTSTKKNLI